MDSLKWYLSLSLSSGSFIASSFILSLILWNIFEIEFSSRTQDRESPGLRSLGHFWTTFWFLMNPNEHFNESTNAISEIYFLLISAKFSLSTLGKTKTFLHSEVLTRSHSASWSADTHAPFEQVKVRWYSSGQQPIRFKFFLYSSKFFALNHFSQLHFLHGSKRTWIGYEKSTNLSEPCGWTPRTIISAPVQILAARVARKISFCLCSVVLLNKKLLRDGESNPGLPRDRRGYSPLYYRGDVLRRIYFYYKLLKHDLIEPKP